MLTKPKHSHEQCMSLSHFQVYWGFKEEGIIGKKGIITKTQVRYVSLTAKSHEPVFAFVTITYFKCASFANNTNTLHLAFNYISKVFIHSPHIFLMIFHPGCFSYLPGPNYIHDRLSDKNNNKVAGAWVGHCSHFGDGIESVPSTGSTATQPITAFPPTRPHSHVAKSRPFPTFIPINHSFCVSCHNLFYIPPNHLYWRRLPRHTIISADNGKLLTWWGGAFAKWTERERLEVRWRTMCSLVYTHTHTHLSFYPALCTR